MKEEHKYALHTDRPLRVRLVPRLRHIMHDIVHPPPVRRRERDEPLGCGVHELECVGFDLFRARLFVGGDGVRIERMEIDVRSRSNRCCPAGAS